VPFLKKVVVGEDEDAIAHLIEATLGDAGWLCLRASDGEAALALVAAEDPDLLILDLLMPKMDGLEAVKRLKADAVWSKVPVLMLTSLGTVDDKVRGLAAGADDYLAKPFDLRELLARAQALVRASRRERDRSPTTDLPGPNALDEALAAQLAVGGGFSLVFLEIDGFDRLRHAHGFAAASDVVRELAAALRATLAAAPSPSSGGSVGKLLHLGGDDFAVVVPGDGARALADRLRSAADALLHPRELAADMTLVDSDGARTTADLAHKVALARARRPGG
jgi:PleD family two-component response regulator